MGLSDLRDHWQWFAPLSAAITALSAWIGRRRLGSLFAAIVRQTTLNRDNVDLTRQLTERTTERDQAIRARDDAYKMVQLLRVALEDLQSSAALVRVASTLIDSDSSPNPLTMSPPSYETSPPGSSASPAPPTAAPPRS